jgi:hypothetical protein
MTRKEMEALSESLRQVIDGHDDHLEAHKWLDKEGVPGGEGRTEYGDAYCLRWRLEALKERLANDRR